MTKPFINTPTVSARYWHICLMRSLYLFPQKTGQRINRLFETIDAVIENQTLRIQTGVLNEILSEAIAMQQPPSDRGKRLKIYYMTQVGSKTTDICDLCQ